MTFIRVCTYIYGIYVRMLLLCVMLCAYFSHIFLSSRKLLYAIYLPLGVTIYLCLYSYTYLYICIRLLLLMNCFVGHKDMLWYRHIYVSSTLQTYAGCLR